MDHALSVAISLTLSLGIVSVYKRLYPKPGVNKAMRRKFMFEVVELIKEKSSRQDKLNAIQSNLCMALVGLLKLNYDSTIKLDVDLDISFRRRQERDYAETLNRSARLWNIFTIESAATRGKKNTRLAAMLERLEPREADLFLKAARKELDLGLSITQLRKAFPQFLRNRRSRND